MQPKVERRPREPEHVQVPPKRGQPAVRDTGASVGAKARLDQVELAPELVGRAVVIGAEALPDRRQSPSVGLGRVAVRWQVDRGHAAVGHHERARHAP